MNADTMMLLAACKRQGFIFRLGKDRWEEGADGVWERTIIKAKLIEGALPAKNEWRTITDAWGTYRERFALEDD